MHKNCFIHHSFENQIEMLIAHTRSYQPYYIALLQQQNVM